MNDVHACPTGCHRNPTRRCYWHGCRCNACRQDHTNYERQRTRMRRRQVSVPRDPWTRLERWTRQQGITIDEYIHALARQVTT